MLEPSLYIFSHRRAGDGAGLQYEGQEIPHRMREPRDGDLQREVLLLQLLALQRGIPARRRLVCAKHSSRHRPTPTVIVYDNQKN